MASLMFVSKIEPSMVLSTHIVEKVWGRESLPPPFVVPEGVRVGEIWFDTPPALSELLVKYMFTSEKLSVQCHPNEEQARALGEGTTGKDECWVVVAAEPGASLGIGFNEPLDADAMRKAAMDGTIESLMTWFEVQAGDVFYIPAGTVHAIGAGCSIVEVQQNTDITYRLYDYGRPRELHLERGMAVASGKPYDTTLHQRLPVSGSAMLVDGPFFRIDLVAGVPDEAQLYSYSQPVLVLPLSGQVLVAGEAIAGPGECAYAPDLASITFAPEGKALVTAPTG